MQWLKDQAAAAPIVFTIYLILYGLEYFFPLVSRRKRNIKSNILLGTTLVTLNVLFTLVTILTSNWILTHDVGLFQQLRVPYGVVVAATILLLDFWSGYIAHLLFHKFRWLWQLHIVHHSDDLVDVTTSLRLHPFESTIRIIFTLAGMVLLGISSRTLLIYLVISTVNSQLAHANIRLPERLDRILQYIFVTPNMHKIHHSMDQRETDTNYGNIFSFWDRMLKTYTLRRDYASIPYGLDTIDNGSEQGLWQLLKLPFRKKNIRLKTRSDQSRSYPPVHSRHTPPRRSYSS